MARTQDPLPREMTYSDVNERIKTQLLSLQDRSVPWLSASMFVQATSHHALWSVQARGGALSSEETAQCVTQGGPDHMPSSDTKYFGSHSQVARLERQIVILSEQNKSLEDRCKALEHEVPPCSTSNSLR